MIRECVVSTLAPDGKPHLSPLGLIAAEAGEESGGWIVAPFHPSATLANLRALPEFVANYVDDVRIIAGLLTGRRDWPLCPSAHIRPPRLAAALAHAELRVVSVREDALRPRFLCRVVSEATHAPFRGFNRAQAAVIEAAILFSRRHLLPPATIAAQLAALRPLVEKTAGAAEFEAWGWLTEAMAG